jgi:hypothetical protein
MLAAAPAQAAHGGSLVQIVSPADGADIHASSVPVTIRLRPGARPPTLQVLLNSRDITARFRRHGHTARAVLTAKDGLVRGTNVLTARVTGPAGALSAAQVTFRVRGLLGDDGAAQVPPTYPLETRVVTQSQPGRGDNFEVVVGDVTHQAPPPTALPASCGNGVWVLALHRGGNNRLDQDTSVDEPLCGTTNAAANKLGSYLASLPTTDMVIVNSLNHDVPPKPVPGLGDALAKIGAVAAEFNGLGAGVSYSVWGIPGLPAGQAYQVGDAWASELTVPAGHATAASINSTLVQDNDKNYTLDMRDYVTFSLGGGQDLSSQGNITVGDNTYKPDPAVVSQLLQDQAAGKVAGGFHVLILDRRTLGVITNKTYPTATGAGPDGTQQAAMASDLGQAAGNLGEGALVLVASLGNPMAAGQAQGLQAPTIAQALAPFGGTPDAINSGADQPGNSNWPYALVGALSPPAGYGLPPVDAPEASPVINGGATGELDGALQRGARGMWYGPAGWNAPYVFDINGQKYVTTQNYGLYQAIGQAPTPWPVPTPGPDYAGELAAYQYLSDLACGTCDHDIRAWYYSDATVISQWRDEINAATNPGTYTNPDTGVTTKISQAEFDAVQNQLACPVDDKPPCTRDGELTDVGLVDGLRDNMSTLLTNSQIGGAQALDKAYQDVSAVVKPPSSSKVGSVLYEILEIVQSLADVLLAGQHPVAGQHRGFGLAAHAHAPAGEEPEANGTSEVIGLVAAILGAANDINDNPGGAQLDQLQTTVGNLKQQTADNFTASLTMLDETFGEILSDWGRLSFVAHGLDKDQPDWGVGAKEGQIVTAMDNAMKIGYYQALIPVVYEAKEAKALPSSDPAKWCEIIASNPCWSNPFSKYVPGTAADAYPVNNTASNSSPAFDLTVVGQKPIVQPAAFGGESGNTPFSAGLMTDLTDLGYYRGWFFQRFPLTRHVCPPIATMPDPLTCEPQP